MPGVRPPEIGFLLCALVLDTVSVGCAPHTTGVARVRALADEYWAAYVERYPEIATYMGVARAPHDRLTDNSLPAVARWQRREDVWLRKLREAQGSVDASAPEWILAATLREALEAAAAARVCQTELWAVSDTFSGWQQNLADWAAAQPVGTAEARRMALSRWKALPRFIDTEIVNLREGLKRGLTAPKSTVRQVIVQVDGLLRPWADSPLLEPGRRDADAAFQSALETIVAEEAQPALRRYRDFLERDYLPAARETVGVGALPAGNACYAGCVRAHTTLELPAREIHELGLREMARLETEMKAIAQRSFGMSDLPALMEKLRTDPRYTYRSKEELIAHATAALERAKAAMPRWFGRLPHADVVIRPQPAFREPTADQYNGPAEDGSRPGVYLISTWEPQKKSRCGVESTAFHETIPGHHLQGVIALERRDVHPILRFGIYDAAWRYNGGYGEGWALYAERLADEMGLFSSDLDRLGMLASQAFRAGRLVVDTGLHVLGWSRAQAIEYMLTHTNGSRAEVESEIDRYISWPGQAVGYMVGALEIQRLRAETEARLGPRFDIRRFHDQVLEDGVVPMGALRLKIDRWTRSTHSFWNGSKGNTRMLAPPVRTTTSLQDAREQAAPSHFFAESTSPGKTAAAFSPVSGPISGRGG